jgi:pimeloyl-ACP methyl ester carboxylesterase
MKLIITAGFIIAAVVCCFIGFPARADEVLPRFEATECWFSQPVGAVDCGYLVVPENRRNANGKTVRVAVATFKGTLGVRYPDPVVIGGGGPGQPVGFTDDGLLHWRRLIRRTPALQQRDVIVVEQRGAGRSEPSLDCDEIDNLGADVKWLAAYDATAIEADFAATIACRDRLLRDGIDLSGYSGVEFAADLADLRRALGYDAWNLVGTSYGTRIALTAMRDHPDGLRAVVLDSVYPLEVQFLEHYWATARSTLDQLFALCDASAVCRETYPDSATRFLDVVARMNASPIVVDVPATAGGTAMALPVSGWMVGDMTLELLAFSDWTTVIAYVDAVSSGNSRLIESTGESIAAKYTDAEQFSDGVYYSALCQEEFPFNDPAAVRQDFRSYSDLLGLDLPDTLPHQCDAWPVPRAPASENAPVSSEIPALLLAGTLDYITPPHFAQLVHQKLPNSYLVEFPNVGHDVISANYCGPIVMNEFLNHPDRQPSSWCAQHPVEPGFR